MKTPLFFIAAIVAFFSLPFDATLMASVLFGAGLTAMLVGDYRRVYRPVTAQPIRVAAQPNERLRLAA